MTTETRPTDQLRPHALNAAIYGEPDADPAFVESIREEGIISPLTIDQGDNIISGHRRWYAARVLGIDRVPVVVREIMDPLDAIRLLIKANRQRARTYSQRMREADEWAGVMAAQSQARMSEAGRQGGQLAGRGRPLADPIGVAPNGATPIGEEVDAATERYNARRNRTFQRERYIWHIANERGGNSDAAAMVARELVKKLDAGAITIYRAEQELRNAEAVIEHRATLPPHEPVATVRPDENEHADAGTPHGIPGESSETHDTEARAEPLEWLHGALSDAGYIAASPALAGLADAPKVAAEAQRALDTLADGRLPLSPERVAALERARSQQATSDAYLAATKDAATTRAEHRAIFFRAVRIIKEQSKACPPDQVLRSLQEGDDQAAHWFLDDLDTWSREMRAALPRRLRVASGERG